MRRLIHLGTAVMVLALFISPVWAQKGGQGGGKGKAKSDTAAMHGEQRSAEVSRAAERSNKGGELRGEERAEQVHALSGHAEHEAQGKKAEKSKGAEQGKKTEKQKGHQEGHGQPEKGQD